jgi:two-component system sensor histidine kinase/response regulator
VNMNTTAPDTPKGDILVVGESLDDLRPLMFVLAEAGYQVRSASSGPMALTAVGTRPPDLILLGINLPGMNGYQLCERLKADEQTRDIPVIFVGTPDEIGDGVKVFGAGGADCAVRPLRFEAVLARVATHLALRDLQRQLRTAGAERIRHLGQVQACNDELEAFAYVVTHDLKNPLSAIVGFSTMLEDRYALLSEQRVTRALASIERSARRMDRLIEDLQLLARVRRAETVELEPLDMARIVAEAQARLAELIQKRQAEVVIPDDWPAALGRSAWVGEVWVNYLSHAIKYGSQPPRVELGADPPGDLPMIRFWGRDNGPGFVPEEQALLFTPFERLHEVRVAGHGLGLPIVRRIVEKLGGEVGVESEPGHGSLFFFTLPVAPQA